MATLPGDVEEQGTEAANLAEQDQVDAAFRDITANYEKTAPEPPAKLKGQVSGSKSSLKKKLLIGGGLGGGVIGIGIILFFLLLFKNIHIKNLFISYEFARFNRGFQNRLEKSIKEADPNGKGTADSTITADATPEAALAEVNSTEVKRLQSDPGAVDETVRNAITLDESTLGTGGQLDTSLELNRGVPDESGKTDEKVARETTADIKDSISRGEQAKGAPIDSIDEAAKQTSAAIDEGVKGTSTLKQIAGAAYESKINGFFQKAQGPLFFATLGCIVEDIFHHGVDFYSQLKFGGLARSAASVAKYADCQKLGKCSMAQIGTVANKFDGVVDGKHESFNDACATVRASGKVAQPGVNCTDLDPNLKPTVDPATIGGIEGGVLQANSALTSGLTLPIIHTKLSLDIACDVILKPEVQAGLAVVGVGGAFLGAISGAADFGVSTVGTAALYSASAIITSKAGKALALDAALHYGGLLFKQNFTPIQWGNLMGAGSKALATDSCRIDGCRPLSQAEHTKLSLDIHRDMLKEQRRRGLAYRLFSPDNPVSTLGMLAGRVPSSPHAALAMVNQFIATTLNPVRFGRSFIALINPVQPAWAADVEYQTYGIPDYGFTDDELNSMGVIENSQWVQTNIDQQHKANFDKCLSASTKMGDILTGQVSGCDAETMKSTPFVRYRLYKLDQRVTQDLVLLYNNQSGSGGGTGSTTNSGAISTDGCINPLTDPGWLLSRTDQGVDYNTISPLPVYAICDATILSVHTPGWPDAAHDVFIYYKLRSGPADLVGKCVYVAENLTPVAGLGTTLKEVKAGQQIATTIPGSPNTEWGWASAPGTPSTPYPKGTPSSNHYPTEGGKSFARFIKQLGGPVRDDPGPGPLYSGIPCAQ